MGNNPWFVSGLLVRRLSGEFIYFIVSGRFMIVYGYLSTWVVGVMKNAELP